MSKLSSEEIAKLRREREQRIAYAWQKLAESEAFNIVFKEDLQIAFPPLSEGFKADESWNPIPAAKRDGNRQVIAHIARRLGIANATLDEEPEKPREAVAEFQG